MRRNKLIAPHAYQDKEGYWWVRHEVDAPFANGEDAHYFGHIGPFSDYEAAEAVVNGGNYE
jgi:hypothetical protein